MDLRWTLDFTLRQVSILVCGIQIAKHLMRIEAFREKVSLLPVNPTVIASLRETAKLYTTHYSTMMEGNQLNPDEVKQVITSESHFPGRKRDEHEVK